MFKENNPFFKDFSFDMDSVNNHAQDLADDIEKYLATEGQEVKDEIVSDSETSDSEEEKDLKSHLLDNMDPVVINEPMNTIGHDSITMWKWRRIVLCTNMLTS